MELNKFTNTLYSLCLLLPLIFPSHAKLYLDYSDYQAFRVIQIDLGIDDHHPSFTRTPCNSPAVSCERRLADYSSVLKITRIHYDSEQLEGFISPAIGQLSELRELTLSTNHLVDRIPEEIIECRKLEVLNLKNNQFSGIVPSELSKLVRLRVLDLSMNRISGDLSFLKHFPNLESLSIANNLFTGKIPASVKLFRNLRFLDTSGNDYIQGPFPVLNGVEYISAEVSRKSLVPRRYILDVNSTRTRRNSSSSAAHNGPAQAPSPSTKVPAHKHHNKAKKVAAWSLGFLVGAVVGGICGMAFSLLVKMGLILIHGGWKSDSGISIFCSTIIRKAEDLAFLEKEDGLDNLEVIGQGGCGKVYKAELPGTGKTIAIKKVMQPPKEAEELSDEHSKMLNKKMRQIRSEVKTVGTIRHRNLLPLLAHVPRPDCHLLVYEYMKNGSLRDLLFAGSTTEFDWLSRYKIALGVASGLEHLHTNINPRIIHRDLKPDNILLDDDKEPRISDFGLAKEMPSDQTHMSTSNVAGTAGYIAPEYYQTHKFTEKCDIYSLGVVIGSLVMGKLPDDRFFETTGEFPMKWMRKVVASEDPKRAIDPKLIGNGYEGEMLQVLKIACFCILDEPKRRPSSKEVTSMLSQIHH